MLPVESVSGQGRVYWIDALCLNKSELLTLQQLNQWRDEQLGLPTCFISVRTGTGIQRLQTGTRRYRYCWTFRRWQIQSDKYANPTANLRVGAFLAS